MIVEKNKGPTKFGIANLGNTCYQNAGLQLLRSIPELNTLIKNCAGGESTEQRTTTFLGAALR